MEQSEISVGDRLEEVNKVVVSDHRGLVCLTFEKRADRLTLSPAEAVQLGEAMSRQAYRAKFGSYPFKGSKQTVEQMRIRARNRVQMLLKDEPITPAEKVARAIKIVDEIFKLVT